MRTLFKILPAIAGALSTTAAFTITNYERIIHDSSFCNVHGDGIYPDSQACNKFIMCGSGSEYEMLCPPGLFFNPDMLACDWEANINCESNTTDFPTESPSIDPITEPTQEPTHPPTENPKTEIHDPTTEQQPSVDSICPPYFNYNVIYIDWKLNWADLKSDIVNAIDNCYNIINLSFWMSSVGYVDAAQTFASLSKDKQKEIIDYAHSKNAKIMLSAGGATEHLEMMVANYQGTDYGERAAQAVLDLDLDGLDFDLELEPGNNGPFLDGSMQQFLIECSQAARDILGDEKLISHAPQGPYLGSWAGPSLGYTFVMTNHLGLIDFLNIQFYNQGSDQYVDYSGLFLKADGWTSETAVLEMIQNGVEASQIVVGKPIGPVGFASNGYVDPNDLNSWTCQFEANHGYKIGGFMNWMYPGPNDSVIEFGKKVSAAC